MRFLGSCGLVGLAAAIGLTGCVDINASRVKVVDRTDGDGPPAVLMKSEAEVRRKLIGRTVRQPGSTGHLALLQNGGKGQVWRPDHSAQAEPVEWTIMPGARVMTGVPPELWFVCLTLLPSAERPRGGQRCTQADLWKVADGAPPPV